MTGTRRASLRVWNPPNGTSLPTRLANTPKYRPAKLKIGQSTSIQVAREVHADLKNTPFVDGH